MERWWLTVLLFCGYGFLSNMKPSEPFLTPYLIDNKGFTNEQTEDQIYPVWTYSQVISLAFVGILAELVGYKFVVLLECVAYLSTRCLLIWGTALWEMQLMQFVFAIGTSTTIVYYSYIYLLVQEKHFQRATSFIRASATIGVMTSGVLGQLLVTYGNVNLVVLNYISFVSVCLACLVALFFPNDFHWPSWDAFQIKNCCFFRSTYHRHTHENVLESYPSEDNQNEDDLQVVAPEEPMGELMFQTHLSDPSTSSKSTSNSSSQQVETDAPSRVCHPEADSDEAVVDHAEGMPVCYPSSLEKKSGWMDRFSVQKERSFSSSTDPLDERSLLVSVAAHQTNLPFTEVTSSLSDSENVEQIRKESPFEFTCTLKILSTWGFLRWSAWWILGNAGDSLITNYVQNLWEYIDPIGSNWNGGVEAIATFVGSMAALLPAIFESNVARFGEIILCLIAIASALVVGVMTITNSIWIAYASYILYRGCYYFLISLASAQIALRMTHKRYALLFGTNLFFSAVIQSLVTFILAITDVNTKTRFFVFSIYFFGIAILFLVSFVYMTITRWRARQNVA